MTQRTIPQIRARLRELAEEHGIPELSELADESVRRFGGRRARVKALKVTPEIEAHIRELAASGTLTQQEISQRVGVTAGRVSETLFGKRGEEAAHTPMGRALAALEAL